VSERGYHSSHGFPADRRNMTPTAEHNAKKRARARKPKPDGMAGQADDANDQAMDDVAYGNDMSLGQGFRE